MKNEIRYMIAGIGLALVGFTACGGFVYTQIQEYNSMMEQRRESEPVVKWIKCEPIGTPEIEHQQDNHVVIMETIETKIEPEPQIEEQESESTIAYEPPFHLTEYETWFVECVVAGEAAGEPYEGKVAVAQCYFDAMLKDGLSATEVKSAYGYDGWNENLDKQDPKAYDEVKNAVMDVFYGGKFVTDKPILYFYNPAYGYSDWHEAQEYWESIANHKFFYLAEDENAEWANILLTNVNEYGIIEPQVMMMYVLYNNKYYLMQNTIKQFVPTSELNEAFQFNDKTKADNALANLPKQMRNLGYFVQQIDAPSKPVDFDQFNNSNLVNYDSALAQIGSFCDLHDQLIARATWVEYKLQEVENKIQDVLHAIEFNSYNARDGYKIYKLLHDLRLERRKYKDEQIIADVMKSGFAGSNWELVRSRVDDLKDRQYHVREMEELFK